MTDCLIVGASFAGLVAARELRGHDVLIVDRSPIGAHQTSACALPSRLVEWFGAAESILHEDTRMHLRIGSSAWNLNLPEPYCVIDYDACCRALAAQCDARFEQIRVVGRDGNSAVGAGGERLAATHLIDASGWRRVLDAGGPTRGSQDGLVIGTEDHVPAGDAPTTNGFAFYVAKTLLKAGYGWSFPAGSHVRAGVGSFTREPLQPAMAGLRQREQIGAGTEHHGGAIACTPREPVQGPVVFVGDAAGQALPVTLEGIRPAAYFGAAAGRLLAASLDDRLTATDAHARYAALHDSHRAGYDRLNQAQRWIRLLPELAIRRMATKRIGPGARSGPPPEVELGRHRYLQVLRAEELDELP